MAELHFETPLWLLALVPLALLLWALSNRPTGGNSWRNIIDKKLQPLLLGEQSTAQRRRWLWLLSIGWLITTIALANPAWQHKPKPVFQTSSAHVIVLDLSTSMAIRDLRPSRLARAKFKIRDLLDLNREGQTGLVVFAGDAFTVTPLTRDNDTIKALLDALEPSIMPVQGSRADLGLMQAGDLLKQSGSSRGQVILIADGAERSAAIAAAKALYRSGHRVSVLGVGTDMGGPLPGLRDREGKPIVVALQRDVLQQIAKAGGGIYRDLDSDIGDIQALLADTPGKLANEKGESGEMQQQAWRAEGPWFVLLLLPLAALAFRRGWLLGVLLAVSVAYSPSPLMASPWQDLWLRKDQQAAKALQAEEFEHAQQMATDPLTRGSAAYKAGKFREATEAFRQATGADAAYNRGNALARLGKYEDAIKAYDQALELQPDMQDAITNKRRVEELLKKMQQQPEQKNNSEQQQQDQNTKQDSQQEKQQQQGSDDQEQKNPEQQQQKDSSGQQSDARQQENKPSEAGDEGEPQKDKQSDSKPTDENQFAKAAEALEKAARDNDKQEEAQKNEPNTAEHQPQKPDDEEQGNDRQQAKQPEPRDEARKEGEKTEASPDAEPMPEDLTDEEKLAAKQWLRRIPDDPGGLLRRKFELQYKARARSQQGPAGNPW